MFENLMDEVKKSEKKNEVKDSTYAIATNPSLNPSMFRKSMTIMDTMSDKDLYDILKYSYSSILNDIFEHNDREYLDVFTKPKFITVLTQVISSINLTQDEKICCNKLIYDYTTLKNNDEQVRMNLNYLATVVNRKEIGALVGVGFPERIASYLALSRYSSKKEDVNVKRLNCVITNAPKDFMTVQNIVYIYEKLFSTSQILIETTMFDVDFYGQDPEWVTKDSEEIYANISLAILTILDSVPSILIYKILKSYAEDFALCYKSNPSSVRFSMKSISEDYRRISSMVDRLDGEGILVP